EREELMAPPESVRRRIAPKEIDPGRIAVLTFSIWLRTLPQLLAITALVHLPLLPLKWWLHEAKAGSLREVLQDFGSSLDIFGLATSGVIAGLAVLLLFQRLRGGPADLGRSIRQGIRRLGTLLVVTAIVFTAIVVVPILLAWLSRKWEIGGLHPVFILVCF